MRKTNLKDLTLEFYRIGLALKYEKKPPDYNPYQNSLDVMSVDIEEFEERKWSNISALSVNQQIKKL